MNNKIDMQSMTKQGVEISDALIKLITERIIRDMQARIADIDPYEDSSAEYGKYWTTGSCNYEDRLELDEPYVDYDITYAYELSWEYRVWTEYWTDPWCSQSFDEIRKEAGEVYGIEIITPDGEKVKQNICEAIAAIINNKIK